MSGICASREKSQRLAWLIVQLIFVLTTMVTLTAASAASGDALTRARDCSRRLYRSKQLMKYRDQWLRCIQGYEAYYQKYPSGRQADEALYSTAKLYLGLYGYSRVSSDLTEATDRYRQVVRKFPKSRFADDAQYQVGEIYRKYKKDLERAYVEYFKVVMDFAQGDMKPRAQRRLKELEAKMGKGRARAALPRLQAASGDALTRARDCSRRLYRSKQLMKYRDQWLRCIQG
jgi:N-acetylmuramoyl-L-alanine amidase